MINLLPYSSETNNRNEIIRFIDRYCFPTTKIFPEIIVLKNIYK